MNPLVECVPDLQFDVAAISAAYQTVRERTHFAVAPRTDDTVRAISLTHRPGAADPFHDGNNSQFDADGRKVYRESEFSVFNDDLKDTYFWSLYQSLPFRVGRIRLMVLPPLTIYGMHRDSTRRGHIAIITNPDCRLVFRAGDSFHIPDDGRLYLVDTRRDHTAYNAGRTERVHMTLSMADTEGDPAPHAGTPAA